MYCKIVKQIYCQRNSINHSNIINYINPYHIAGQNAPGPLLINVNPLMQYAVSDIKCNIYFYGSLCHTNIGSWLVKW